MDYGKSPGLLFSCIYKQFHFLPKYVLKRQHTTEQHERDLGKQHKNFIPVIDTALFSIAMDIACYDAAINEISKYAEENFLFGGILNTGNSFPTF